MFLPLCLVASLFSPAIALAQSELVSPDSPGLWESWDSLSGFSADEFSETKIFALGGMNRSSAQVDRFRADLLTSLMLQQGVRYFAQLDRTFSEPAYETFHHAYALLKSHEFSSTTSGGMFSARPLSFSSAAEQLIQSMRKNSVVYEEGLFDVVRDLAHRWDTISTDGKKSHLHEDKELIFSLRQVYQPEILSENDVEFILGDIALKHFELSYDLVLLQWVESRSETVAEFQILEKLRLQMERNVESTLSFLHLQQWMNSLPADAKVAIVGSNESIGLGYDAWVGSKSEARRLAVESNFGAQLKQHWGAQYRPFFVMDPSLRSIDGIPLAPQSGIHFQANPSGLFDQDQAQMWSSDRANHREGHHLGFLAKRCEGVFVVASSGSQSFTE